MCKRTNELRNRLHFLPSANLKGIITNGKVGNLRGKIQIIPQ